jgi:hypothetical protein
MTLLSRLSPAPRLYFETAGGVEEPPPRRGRRYWIVARSLCRFLAVPLLPEAPTARQLEAIELEIKRSSPFSETGSYFHLGREVASVWIWDQAATRAAAAAVGADLARLRILPEPAMHPGGDDGVRLVASLDGVEGQNWAGGSLTASRWWRTIPDARSWMLFQQGASVHPDRIGRAIPNPQRLPWLQRPRTQRSRRLSFSLAETDLRLVAAALAAAIVIAYGYQGSQWLRLRADTAALAAEIKGRSNAVEPLLAWRTRALDNLASIQALRELDRYPSQLALMARIAEVLPREEARLTGWLYDRGQLDVELAADQPLDVVKLVRSLESVERFKAVAAERTGSHNDLRLRITIDPL